MFDINDRNVIVSALKAAKADIVFDFTASGSLGERIDNLTVDRSSDSDVLEAYDDFRAYRLPVVDSAFSTAINELRLSQAP